MEFQIHTGTIRYQENRAIEKVFAYYETPTGNRAYLSNNPLLSMKWMKDTTQQDAVFAGTEPHIAAYTQGLPRITRNRTTAYEVKGVTNLLLKYSWLEFGQPTVEGYITIAVSPEGSLPMTTITGAGGKLIFSGRGFATKEPDTLPVIIESEPAVDCRGKRNKIMLRRRS